MEPKRNRRHIKRIQFPPFDDEAPPFGLRKQRLGQRLVEPLEAAGTSTSSTTLNPWLTPPRSMAHLIDTGRFPRRRWPTSIASVTLLLFDYTGITPPIFSTRTHSSQQKRAKALNTAIPGGPKFEPLYNAMDTFDEDWTEFSDTNEAADPHRIQSHLPPSLQFPSPLTLQRTCTFAPRPRTCPPFSARLPTLSPSDLRSPRTLRWFRIDISFSGQTAETATTSNSQGGGPLPRGQGAQERFTAGAIALWWAPSPYVQAMTVFHLSPSLSISRVTSRLQDAS